MLSLSKVIKPWKEAAALSDHINLYGFWNETAFLTKSGDLGIVLSVTGVDYESLDYSGQEYAVEGLRPAIPLLKRFTIRPNTATFFFESEQARHMRPYHSCRFRGNFSSALPIARNNFRSYWAQNRFMRKVDLNSCEIILQAIPAPACDDNRPSLWSCLLHNYGRGSETLCEIVIEVLPNFGAPSADPQRIGEFDVGKIDPLFNTHGKFARSGLKA